MSNKMKVFLGMLIGLISIICIFLIINREQNSGDEPVLLDDGPYHYVRGDLLEVSKDEIIFETMMIHEDNNLIYMVQSADGCYVYKGFGEDREVLSPNVESPIEDLDVKGFTMDDEENIYVLYGVYRGKEKMNIYNKDKELVEADIDMEGDVVEVKNMYYANEKLYILDHDRNLFIHTVDGKLINDINNPNSVYSGDVMSIDMDEKGNMYMIKNYSAMGQQGNIIKVDCEFDQVIFDIKMEAPLQDIIEYSKINERIYSTDGKNIYEFDLSGNLISKEVEFQSDAYLAFGDMYDRGVHSLRKFLYDGKGNFYLYSHGNKSLTNDIYILTRTSGAKPLEEPKQEIILTAAYEQDFIVNAIAQYNLESEGYEIVLDAQYKTYDEFMQNAVEAGEKLAVQIMANDVGDIVATGGNALNYYDLFKTDAFMDLSEFIKNDKNYKNLNKNVLDGITIDGNIRGLPLGIAYFKMVYNKDLGNTLDLNLDLESIRWSEILELAIKLDDENSNVSVFNTQEQNPSTYFILLLQANMPDLIDIENKKVDLRQDWFLELVSDFKTASKLDSFMHYRSYDNSNITGDDSLFYFENLKGRHREEIRNIENNTHEILRIPTFTGEENRNAIAFPYIMYSISNNSENKEAAWDFLSFLSNTETQLLSSLNSHPVNLQTEKDIRELYDMEPESSKQFDEIINRVDYLYDMSYYKQDIVLPIEKYFNDEISLEEAIDEAEKNVWLRLNE